MIMTLLYGFVLIPLAFTRAWSPVLCLGTGAALLPLVFRLADRSDPDPVVEQPANALGSERGGVTESSAVEAPASIDGAGCDPGRSPSEAPWRRQRSHVEAADRPSLRPSLRLRQQAPPAALVAEARPIGRAALSARGERSGARRLHPARRARATACTSGVRGQPGRAHPRRDLCGRLCSFRRSRGRRPVLRRVGHARPHYSVLVRAERMRCWPTWPAVGGAAVGEAAGVVLGLPRRLGGSVRRRAALARAMHAAGGIRKCSGRASRSAARRLHVSAGQVTERYRSCGGAVPGS